VRCAKAFVTAALAGALAAEAFWGPNTAVGKGLIIVTAVLGTFAVWRVPNRPDPPGSGS
jgi:hypothetical protein